MALISRSNLIKMFLSRTASTTTIMHQSQTIPQGQNVLTSIVDKEREKKLEYLKSWAGVSGKIKQESTIRKKKSPLSTSSIVQTNISKCFGVKVVGQTFFSVCALELQENVTIEDIEQFCATNLGKMNDSSLHGFAIDLRKLKIKFNPECISRITELMNGFKACDVVPIGIIGDSDDTVMHYLSLSINYPLLQLNHDFKQDQEVNLETSSSCSVRTSDLMSDGSTMVHQGNVRSGQQVKAPSTHSLLVLGSVNPGAEVFAGGSIYIWGNLKGRAFAGIGSTGVGSGSVSDHKIMTLGFDAELVAIDDAYATIDNSSNNGTKWKRNTATTIFLKDGVICFNDESAGPGFMK